MKRKFSFKDIPGWVTLLSVFGLLYVTGLHTEAIGQAQRLILATGLINANIAQPTTPVVTTSGQAVMVGNDFQMIDLDGNIVTFQSLKGKVVFLNIWATWCPPCVAEMPNIQSLYEKVGSDKIAFVMLSVDQKGLQKVKKYIAKKGYTFPVYLPHSNFPVAFETNSIPSTFILSPAGQIVAKQEGMAEYDTKEVRDFLLKLAN